MTRWMWYVAFLGPKAKPMGRREFIALIGSSAADWPGAAFAQSPVRAAELAAYRARDCCDGDKVSPFQRIRPAARR
jgi:hypothetical protein